MLDLGVLKASIVLDDKGAKKELRKISDEAKKTADDVDGLKETLSSFGDKAGKVGKKLSKGLTAPITAIGGLALKAGMDFEAGMSKVQAISGASVEDMAKLEAKAKEMGATTKFTATEASEGLLYMAMAGWDAEKMLAGLPGILSLAAADGLDLATTSDIVTDAMTAFGLSADKAGDFADLLAVAASSSNTNVSMLGESFKYVAPVAGAFGYAVEDTALALGLMANAGIKSSMAGTSMRQILTSLTGVIALNVGGMENWKIQCENADGTMVPLRQQFVNLREAFAQMTDAERAQNAEMIAGKNGMSGLLAIMTASDKDFNTLINNIDNAGGAAQRAADIMQDNVKGQLVILFSALEATGIAFYDCIKEPLKEAIQVVADFVSSLIPLVAENGKLIAVLGGVAASIGPVLVGISKLISIVTSLMNPLTLVVVGCVAVGAALVKLYNENEEFTKGVDELWQKMQVRFSVLMDLLKKLFSVFIDWSKDAWEKYGDKIASVAITLINILTDVFDDGFSILNNLIAIFIAFFQGDFESMSEYIKNIAGTLWKMLEGIFKNGIDALGTVLPLMYQLGKDMIVGLWNGLKAAWHGVTRWVSDSFKGMINDIKATFDIHSPSRVMKEIGKNVVDGFRGGLENGEKDVANAMQDVGNAALNVIRQFNDSHKDLMTKSQKETYESRKSSMKNYIEEQKYYNKLSLDEEYNLYLGMKDLAKMNREEVAYWEREMYRVKKEMREKDIQNLKDANAKYRELYMQQVTEANEILKAQTNEEIQKLQAELDRMGEEDKVKAYEERYSRFTNQIKDLEKKLAQAGYEERKAIETELKEKEKEFDEWIFEEERKVQREALKKQMDEERALLEEKIKNNEEYAKNHLEIVDTQLKESIKAIENGTSTETAVQQARKQTLESIDKETLDSQKNSLVDREIALEESNNKIKDKTTNFATEMYKENYSVGAAFANGIADGILNQTYRVASAIEQMVEAMKGGLDKLGSNTLGKFNGSHESGINYVPFDGYTAQLHKGERVLTAEQARDYSEISTSRMESLLEQLNMKLDRLPRNLAIETRF